MEFPSVLIYRNDYIFIQSQHDPDADWQQLLFCVEDPFLGEMDIPPEITLRTFCPVSGCSDMGLSLMLCLSSKRVDFSFLRFGIVS
tara:strand:+ start:278 stop:535 length:258 start_codon:yes stop_codon:yes gene_type:complete